MLCHTCRRALIQRMTTSQRASSTNTFIRTIATVPSTPNAAPSTSPPPTSDTPSSTSSTVSGESQPFSTPMIPKSARPSASTPKQLQSSLPGGMELRGLNYTRGAPPLLAKEDHEYPNWLWSLLDSSTSGDSSNPKGSEEVTHMSKKARAKFERKQAKLMANVEKPIPIHEQSKDLTGPEDDAFTSFERRLEITKSARVARRKDIREDNFLRGM